MISARECDAASFVVMPLVAVPCRWPQYTWYMQSCCARWYAIH